MNINRCELSGNVTRDGELKATRGGTAVLLFGLAFNDRKRNAAGEWENVPNFIDCVIYGKLAESLAQYVTKGQKLFVAGKLHYSSWEHEGQKRSRLELIIDTIDLASGRKQGEQQAARQAPAYSTPPAPVPDLQDDLYDEEIPFSGEVMTRREEANRLATRAYNAAVEIVNNAPDMGVALAALSQVSRWMQAECDSVMITENKMLANIVFEGDER